MLHRRKDSEVGVTIVEYVIALSLFGLVVLVSINFLREATNTRAEKSLDAVAVADDVNAPGDILPCASGLSGEQCR